MPLTFSADPKIVLAVNGHVRNFGFFRRRLVHLFTYASMTRALTDTGIAALGGERTWGVTPSDPLGTTVRRISGTGGDRIVVRNRFTYDPSMEIDDRRVARMGVEHDRSFARRFPTLAGVGMEYRWGGRLCLSRNGAPAFGEVNDGVFSACCQNGLGTVRGTLSGMLAAELATGTEGELLASMRRQGAPSCLPPEPIAWLGATVTIRFKEWQAGREL